jgi:arylsulfatase A-like enzyme
MRAMRARNVLLITADQLRGDALGHLGHPVARTPNLDRLAREGVGFARHFSAASPCGPARASLHTGLHAHHHRSVINGTPLDSRIPTMATVARAAGRSPTLFGYTDTTADPTGLAPDDPRLFTYEGLLPGYALGLLLPEHHRAWLDHVRARRPALPDEFKAAHRPVDGRVGGAAAYPAALSPTAFVADAALDWLARQAPGWFAHVSFLRPHPPWAAPAEFLARLDPAAMPAPRRAPRAADDAALHPLQAAILADTRADSFVPGAPGLATGWTDAEIARVRATYFALVAEVDHHVGRLLDALDASGAARDTLVVFTADHGECLGDHHLFGKRGFVEEAYRVPLIVRDPAPAADAARGRVVDAFTESVDVMPTVLFWLGLEAPSGDGVALAPWLHGETPAAWRDAAHWSYDFRELLAAHPALGTDPHRATLLARRDATRLAVRFADLPPLLLAPDAPGPLAGLGEPARAAAMAEAMLAWRLGHENRLFSDLQATPSGLKRWR